MKNLTKFLKHAKKTYHSSPAPVQMPPGVSQKRSAPNLMDILQPAIDARNKQAISEESFDRISSELSKENGEGVSESELKSLVSELLKLALEKQVKKESVAVPAEEPKTTRRVQSDFSLSLPSTSGGRRRPSTQKHEPERRESLLGVNITYPLIYKGGKVHVYANIRYDPRSQGLLYKVIEPVLTPQENEMLKRIESTLVEELEVDFSALKTLKAEQYLSQKLDSVISYYNFRMSERTRHFIEYYIQRNFIGFGKIDSLLNDPNIEDISCDGVGVPIYVYHRDQRFGSVRTNVKFDTEEELDSFVMRLSQKCGRSISIADPLLDGALPDGSRVQATFGSGISMKGSNFTIRKFTADPMTCIDLLNYGTVNSELLAYLWLAIEHGKSILIAGPTASGKTTMLNALSLFIRPELKVITIEDTPELRLPHENWVSQVSRTGFGPEGVSGKKLGEIDLFDLLKASLRQRPDIIIVGEGRGREAYVLFQQMATGHPGLSTIHAESMMAVVNRLRTPPINLPPSLLQHLDLLLVLTRQRIKGKYIRRSKELVEITGYDIEKDIPKTNTAFTGSASNDKYSYSGKSSILKLIMEITGGTPDSIYEEVKNRMKVLDWMKSKNIRDYRNVGRVIHEYYQNPSKLLNHIK